MHTKPEQFAALTEAQKYERLLRAELQRDNAELYARELSAQAARRELAGPPAPGEHTQAITRSLAA